MHLLLLAFLPSLHAFAPGTTHQGIEPRRLMTYVPGTQALLRAQPAWKRFTSGEGSGWRARFDPLTGTAFRASGPGIAMGDPRDARSLEKSARAFLARHEDLLGVSLAELRLRTARYDAQTSIGYMEFDRLVDGVPVWGGGVTLRTKFGKLVLLGVETYPGAPRPKAPTVSSDDARFLAMDAGPAPLADHREASERLVLLPLPRGGDVEWHLAWETRSRTQEPAGAWVSFVDAHTGELLHVYNEVRFLDGTLYGVHDTRTPDGRTSTSPMPLMTLREGSGTSTTTAADGTFRLAGEGATATFRGSWLRVDNQGGGDGSLSFSGTASPTWTSAAGNFAEIDSWVFLHTVHAWAQRFSPSAGVVTGTLTANVNLGETCNAYYDGSVNFFVEGGGCNNSGRIADVAYHEWGHGLHYTSLLAGTFDGSISEGIGDVSAALQTLDPIVAPNFLADGGYIRRIDEDRVYPDDVVNEVHEDGLIYASTAWDLLGNLQATYGEGVSVKGRAWEVSASLFATAMRAGPTIPQAFDEYLVADDDDGDLGNGTPHVCEIVDAFSRHGLGPAGGTSLLSLAHEALGNQAAEVSIPLSATLQNLAPQCVSSTLGLAEVVYSLDGGATWRTQPLDVRGESVTGALPALPAGTIVQYYLRGTASDGQDLSLPAGGSIAPYTFYVGELTQISCENFNDDSGGGYTHELIAGQNREGADDWLLGQPMGMSGDPDRAFSGRKSWGNDLGGGNYNGAYQADVTNRLTSAPIDVSGQERVIVQYRRWLNVEDGVYDVATVYANGEPIWENHGTNQRVGNEHTADSEWILHTLEVAPGSDTLTLAWEIDSDGGLEFGGWNVDDVCVYGVAPALDESWRVKDFAASDEELGLVRLTWTQPEQAGANWAVVVRRDDRFGEGREDGEVVFSASDLEPGQTLAALDDFTGEGWYAVYTGDGSRFVSGAVEGENADLGAGLTEEEAAALGEEGILIQKEGCGCASTRGGAPGAWAVAGIAVWALRRRRSASRN